jgi:hypothetical protein
MAAKAFAWAIGVGTAMVVALGTGCSSSKGSPATCNSVSSGCGGNIVGTWTFTSECFTGDVTTAASQDCAGASGSVSSIQVSGTATFNSDGSYSLSLNQTVDETDSIPSSCLTQDNVTLTCAELQQVFSGLSGDGGTGGTCTTSGSGCNCAFSIANSDVESGTYTTSGSTLTTTPTANSGASMGSGSYCVNGNTLTYVPSSTTGVLGQLTATK